MHRWPVPGLPGNLQDWDLLSNPFGQDLDWWPAVARVTAVAADSSSASPSSRGAAWSLTH